MTTPKAVPEEVELSEVLTKLENAVEQATLARIHGRTYNNRMIHAHAMTRIADILGSHRQATIKEVVEGEYKGAWGITSLEQVLETLAVAENMGDVTEAAEALEAILEELRAQWRAALKKIEE